MDFSDHFPQSFIDPPRVVLITGATGTIGKAIALQIAALPGYSVILVARDETRARQAVMDIREHSGNPSVRYVLADLARQSSIQALAQRWKGALHVLINNAAASPRLRQVTPEGIELQFATNVLGYFWLTQAFTEILRRSAPARVVNVASYWAGNLRLDDLEFIKRRYDNNQAYRQSKQANRMLTVAFAQRLKPLGITVNACHPGDVDSKLSNDLGFGGSETPAEGAATPIWLATVPEAGGFSGLYFENQQPVRCLFGEDRQAVDDLYAACLRYSQL